MFLADSHAHIEMDSYDKDRDLIIQRAREHNLKLIITIGFNIKESKRAVNIANKYELIYAAVGIHPHDAKEVTEESYINLTKIVKENNKVVAMGEMGLDYHYNNSPQDVQKKVFKEQIILAKELKKPIVIHSREAEKDTLEIITQEKAYKNQGIMHCFSGSYELAKKYLDMGFYISFAGPITFPKAINLQNLVKKIPLDRILIETDCPYLSPQPFRGKRNEPAYVTYVAEKIAELKNLNIEEVAETTFKNTREVFGIPNNL